MCKKVIVIITTIILAIGSIGCAKEETNEQLSRTELFMGTAVKITLYDHGSEDLLDMVFDHISEIENLVSINKEGTEIVQLNKNAGIKGVKLSDFSYNLIKSALEYSKLSDGGYDVSIGPLVKLWSIGLPEAKVPRDDEIEEAIKNIDYTKVNIDDSNNEVFLSEKGMMIDLGSIAKGYVADDIVNILKENEVERAIIDLGGNIYAMGTKSKEDNWKIGIQNPSEDRGQIVGTIEVADKSVVTTGTYERFIEEDKVRYHHVLNPKTGYPYETNIAGVTIVADRSVDADALSTLVFTKGLDEGLQLVEKLESVDAIFIMNDNSVYVTEGLKGNFKLTNDSFKISN